MNLDQARERLLDLATAAVRLHDPQPEYLELVAPGEVPAVARGLGKASGCGLVVRGLWGLLGLEDARLRAPYKIGSVMTTIREMADEAGAWQPAAALRAWLVGELAGGAYELAPCDVLFLSTPEHVATVVSITHAAAPDVGAHVYSIDGGQRLAGAEAVLRVERDLIVSPTGTVEAGPFFPRPVLGAISFAAMCARFLPGFEA